MALPTLTPISQTSSIILTSTGSEALVNAACPFKVYSDTSSPLYSTDFLSGASDQVAFTYKKLGGDVLDIELTPSNVYQAYEEAALEYSFMINLHQSKNSLSSMLGSATGTFDHDGNLKSGSLSSSLGGEHAALMMPRFTLAYSKRIWKGFSTQARVNPEIPEFSASIDIVDGKQDYDLQAIISSSAATDPDSRFYGLVGNKRVEITKVFYKTPRAMWRFYGYYGGLSVVGNMQTYGQWADNSTFEVIPVWQNKLQAAGYEDALRTRYSHFSYELTNNMLRLFPVPRAGTPRKMWVRFVLPQDAWGEDSLNSSVSGNIESQGSGINNLNTLPFGNIPYENINSMGKVWIRRYALALSMETLGYIRSKFDKVPIPNDNIVLNGTELINRGRETQEQLKKELNDMLQQLTYDKLMEIEADMAEKSQNTAKKVPLLIYVG